MQAMVGLKTTLIYHLQHNHYPPIDLAFLPSAETAVKAATQAVLHDRDEPWGEMIDLPNGKRLTVAQIVEQLHLDVFIDECAVEEMAREGDE